MCAGMACVCVCVCVFVCEEVDPGFSERKVPTVERRWLILQNFLQNCMNREDFGRQRGSLPSALTLDPLLARCVQEPRGHAFFPQSKIAIKKNNRIGFLPLLREVCVLGDTKLLKTSKMHLQLKFSLVLIFLWTLSFSSKLFLERLAYAIVLTSNEVTLLMSLNMLVMPPPHRQITNNINLQH